MIFKEFMGKFIFRQLFCAQVLDKNSALETNLVLSAESIFKLDLS